VPLSAFAVLNCIANHTPKAGKRKNNAGKLEISEAWVSESGVSLQILFKLRQLSAGVPVGAHDRKVRTFDPLAIFVRSTHNHNIKRQNQNLPEKLNTGDLNAVIEGSSSVSAQ
jgi:hypothetical protein